MYNLGIHFGTSFTFECIDYDAQRQIDRAKSIIFYDAIGSPLTVHISGNQTLVQQLAKYLAKCGIPYILGKIPACKEDGLYQRFLHTHVIPNNR